MSADVSKKRVLLVDDDPLFVRMYERLLLQAGYEVKTGRNGKEGIEQMRKNEPALVILDMLMPEMNGLTMLREAKHDPQLGHIPIIMLSSLSDDKNRLSCLEAGATAYYVKDPKTIKALLEEIKAILG